MARDHPEGRATPRPPPALERDQPLPQFYELVQTSQRGYELLTEQIELNVNALVRMDVAFEPVKARQKVVSVPIPARGSARLRAQAKPTPPPTTAPKRKQMHFLGEPQNNEILASLAQVRL